jgi:hypothetical protein
LSIISMTVPFSVFSVLGIAAHALMRLIAC